MRQLPLGEGTAQQPRQERSNPGRFRAASPAPRAFPPLLTEPPGTRRGSGSARQGHRPLAAGMMLRDAPPPRCPWGEPSWE